MAQSTCVLAQSHDSCEQSSRQISFEAEFAARHVLAEAVGHPTQKQPFRSTMHFGGQSPALGVSRLAWHHRQAFTVMQEEVCLIEGQVNQLKARLQQQDAANVTLQQLANSSKEAESRAQVHCCRAESEAKASCTNTSGLSAAVKLVKCDSQLFP